MARASTFLASSSSALVLAICALDANAFAQRTFVASRGVDTNPCSLAAPCRSFTAALAQTNSGGEIIVLDSAGYGVVTIDKSVTIAAPAGIYAGITVPVGFDGVTIATPGVSAVLRGLTINGQGGFSGVNLLFGASLVVEDCVISGMSAAGLSLTAPNATVSVRNAVLRDNANAGIYIGNGSIVDVAIDHATIEHNGSGMTLQTGARVHMRDSSIAHNLAGGVSVAPNIVGPGTFARLTMTRSSLIANGGIGLVVSGDNSKETPVSIADSEIADNAGDGIAVSASASGTAVLALSGSRIHNNGGIGVSLVNSGGTVRGDLASDTITRNASFGVQVSGGATALSNGANLVKHNLGASDVSGTITPGAI